MNAVFSTIYIYVDNIHFHCWAYIYFCSTRNQHWTCFSFPFWIHKSRYLLFCNIALTDNTYGYNYKRKKTFTNNGMSVNCNRYYIEMATIRLWQSFQQSGSFIFVSKHSPKLELHFCHKTFTWQNWSFTIFIANHHKHYLKWELHFCHKTFTKVGTSLLSQFTKHSLKLELHLCHNWMSQNIHQCWNFNFAIKDSPKLKLNFCNQNYN